MPNAIQDPLDRLATIIDGEKSPFVELSERMKDTSKDVQNLNLSILNLAIALEKRAGVKKDKDKEDPKVEQARNYQDDLGDFSKGFADVFTSPFKKASNYFTKDYFTGKTEMPADIDKIKQDTSEEQDMSKNTILQQDNTKEPDISKNTILQQDENQNKVLADMVAVLIDMRDDKSQKQLLDETISIKKLLTDQGKKVEINKGLEPNNEESKQEDREKLAEAIARKLSETLQENGIGGANSFGLPSDLPDRPDRRGRSRRQVRASVGGASPTTSGGGKFKLPAMPTGLSMPKIPPGVGMAAGAAGTALGVGGLLLGAYDASEYLDETGYGDAMNEGAGKEAEKAFKNINADFSKLDITPEQAQDILDQPDSPGKQRDLKAFGGEDELKKKASERKQFEQSSLRKYDYVAPKTSPKIDPFEPKPTETDVGKILNEVNDKNTELKMFNSSSAAPQMLAPIISNKTINNTEQTMIASTPSPHSTASSFVKWQMNRSNYA